MRGMQPLRFFGLALLLAGCAEQYHAVVEFPPTPSVDDAKHACIAQMAHETTNPGVYFGAVGGLIGGVALADQRIAIHRKCMYERGWAKS